MTTEFRDSVKDQTTTTGTGTVTLAGITAAGHRTLAQAHTTGATVTYRISNVDNTEWEVGTGIFTAASSSLSRLSVFVSSNSNALVNFSAGTKSVITTLTANDANNIVFKDVNGDLVANIVPRSGTSAALQSIIGSQGELASATDTPAIIQYYGGTTPGGDVFTLSHDDFGTVSASYTYFSFAINTAGFIYPIDHLSFYDGGDAFTCGLVGYSDVSGNILASFDRANWFKIMPPTGVPCRYATNGMQIIGIPIAASTQAYILDINSGAFATWTTMTGATGTSQAWNPPVIVSPTKCVITPVAASAASAILDFGTKAVTQLNTLPSAAAWKVVAAQKPGNTGAVYAVAYSGGTGAINLAAFSGSATFNWTDISVPVPVIAPKIIINKNAIIYSGSTQYYSAEIIGDYSYKTAWLTAVAVNLNATVNSFVGNGDIFFTSSTINGVSGLYQSNNGVVWNLIKCPNLANLIPINSGFIASDNVLDTGATRTYTILVTATNKYSRIHGFNATTPILKPINNTVIQDIDHFTLNIGGGIVPGITPQVYADATNAVVAFEGVTFMTSSIATQATMTVALPPIPVDAQEFKIRFTSAQTSVTFSPTAMPTGTLIDGAATLTLSGATAVTAKKVLRFTYDLTANQWYLG